MATLIDQRVLIPAPPHAVWAILADSTQLPKWRVDCQQVQFLTPRQFGLGTRRQCITDRGQSKLEEITAWYEGLGYEYNMPEAKKYSEWTSRLRLQAIPEGTVVQWTITYHPKGIINRILNRIGGKAELEEETADSLRNLRRIIEMMGYNVEQRKRQTLQPVQKIVRSSTQPIMVPVTDSAADTQPRKPEGLQEAIYQQQTPAPVASSAPIHNTPPAEKTPTPSPANPMPAVPIPSSPTPLPIATDQKPVTALSPTQTESDSKLPPGMPESLKATPPKNTPKVDLSRVRFADEVGEEAPPAPAEEPPKPTATADNTTTQELPPPTNMQDTGEISIWEAFGVAPPSKADNQALDEVIKRSTGEFDVVTTDATESKSTPNNIQQDNLMIEPPLKAEDTFTFSPLYMSQSLRLRTIVNNNNGLRQKQARESVKLREMK